MRPVLHGDLTSLARLLLSAAPGERQALCARVIGEAEQADAHLARTGRVHPLWGNGSLMSAARKRPLPDEPGLDDAEYCDCLETALQVLSRWRAGAGQPAAQAMQSRAVGSSRSRAGAIASPQSSHQP